MGGHEVMISSQSPWVISTLDIGYNIVGWIQHRMMQYEGNGSNSSGIAADCNGVIHSQKENANTFHLQ